MLNIKVVTWSLAIWAAFTFVFCVVYGMVTPAKTPTPAVEFSLWSAIAADADRNFCAITLNDWAK